MLQASSAATAMEGVVAPEERGQGHAPSGDLSNYTRDLRKGVVSCVFVPQVEAERSGRAAAALSAHSLTTEVGEH